MGGQIVVLLVMVQQNCTQKNNHIPFLMLLFHFEYLAIVVDIQH